MRNRAAIAILSVLPWLVPAQASKPAQISGSVIDFCGNQLTNVAVVSITPTGKHGHAASVRTDADGDFTFFKVAPGSYDLRIEALGAKPFLERVDFESGNRLRWMKMVESVDPVMCPTAAPLLLYEAPELPQMLTSSEPLSATLCEIASAPEQFNGKMVRVTGRIRMGFEDFELPTADCDQNKIGDQNKMSGIWLEYGRAWCCGDVIPSDRFTLIENDDFRKFYRIRMAAGLAHYGIMATLIGRFDFEKAGHFGHLGAFQARMVIQSVSDAMAVSGAR